MAFDRDEQGRAIVRLDGTVGVGLLCRLTIITADKMGGVKEETFEFPYGLINFKLLQDSLEINYILGYRVEKMIPADDQPITFKIGSPAGGEQ